MRTFTLIVFTFLLFGCATSRTAPTSAPVSEPAERMERAWRYYRVRFRRDDLGRTQWHLGPLVAAEIFAPMLHRHRADIPLWRFHRRSARDEAGHQFTLLVYADDATAARLERELRSHALIPRLKSAGVVRDLVMSLDKSSDSRQVRGSSDPSWSAAMQRAWPQFIMGVSRTWLELVQARGRPAGPIDTAGLVAHYRAVQQQVTETWNKEGGHAFLHHLNAVFGYEPLKVQMIERGEVRF